MNQQQFENILRDALCPPIDPADPVLRGRPHGKGQFMNTRKWITRLCTAAVIAALLTTTAYATDALNIRSLVSGFHSRSYDTMEAAEQDAGFQMDSLDTFSSGYALDDIRVEQVRGLDDRDQVRLTYKEISVTLKNPAGESLHLSAYLHHDSLTASDTDPDQTRTLGEIPLEYRLHHYRFMPADYVPTEADKTWLRQPGNYMSYGAKTPYESSVSFLNWEKDGVCYLLMDSDGSESADTLFNMASELILRGK